MGAACSCTDYREVSQKWDVAIGTDTLAYDSSTPKPYLKRLDTAPIPHKETNDSFSPERSPTLPKTDNAYEEQPIEQRDTIADPNFIGAFSDQSIIKNYEIMPPSLFQSEQSSPERALLFAPALATYE